MHALGYFRPNDQKPIFPPKAPASTFFALTKQKVIKRKKKLSRLSNCDNFTQKSWLQAKIRRERCNQPAGGEVDEEVTEMSITNATIVAIIIDIDGDEKTWGWVKVVLEVLVVVAMSDGGWNYVELKWPICNYANSWMVIYGIYSYYISSWTYMILDGLCKFFTIITDYTHYKDKNVI